MRDLTVLLAGILAGILVGVAGTLAVSVAGRERHATATHPTSSVVTASVVSELAPTLAQYRYRFDVERAPDQGGLLRVLEARAAAPSATKEDFNELADAYLQRALAGGGPDDFAAAEAMATKSLAVLPFPNGANVTLAKLAAARHDFRGAIAQAQAVLTKQPQVGAYGVLAAAHLALGELAEASIAAEAATRLLPGPGTYVLRALVLQAQGRDAEAAFDFTRAVATEDFGDAREAARIRALWGRFLLRRNAVASAGAVIDEALRVAPDDPLALAQRAELFLRTGKLPEARAAFERAFSLSRQLRYLVDLARAQAVAGDAAAALHTRAQVEKLVRADLAGADAGGYGHGLLLVELLLDRGATPDLAEALTLAQTELARRPSADTRFQLARALAATGDRVTALDQVRLILGLGVREARTFELAARLERGARAAMYGREAARLDPGGSTWRALGMPAWSPP